VYSFDNLIQNPGGN